MTTYSVYESADGEETVLVGGGFSVSAIVFGGLWFVWHRMWLGLLGYFASVLLLVGLAAVTGLHPVGGLILQALFALMIGCEAETIRRWHVERSGFTEVGVASGDTVGDAELRYFFARDVADASR